MTGVSSIPAESGRSFRTRSWICAVSLVLLAAAFVGVFYDLARYCRAENLFDYTLAVPFIAAWLVAMKWRSLDQGFKPAPWLAAGLVVVAALLLSASFLPVAGEAVLGLRMLVFVLALNGICAWTLGGRVMSQLAFPAVFLAFCAPPSMELVNVLETGLQHASAEVSAWFFTWAGIPFFRDGLSFQLPTITLKVAPECSGIRSTLVLFITSLVAGYLYLRGSVWQRAAFTALVIPLGIVRNAFRIVTIGWLCTHHGPEMIHSPIHHKGGPVFFAISLVPLFAMLWFFRKVRKPPAVAESFQ